MLWECKKCGTTNDYISNPTCTKSGCNGRRPGRRSNKGKIVIIVCLLAVIMFTLIMINTRTILTVNFNANGATYIGATSKSCTIFGPITSCTVTAPSITQAGNNRFGWSTNSDGPATNIVGSDIILTRNNTGSTYYAIAWSVKTSVRK